jgi:hypothetical protein
MGADIIVAKAKQAGVTLYLHEGQLRYRGDRQAVELLLPELRAHKAEIIEALAHVRGTESTNSVGEFGRRGVENGRRGATLQRTERYGGSLVTRLPSAQACTDNNPPLNGADPQHAFDSSSAIEPLRECLELEVVQVLSIQDAANHVCQGKVAQLYSETLQESILVVESEALASRLKSGVGATWVVYALSELHALKGISKDSLRSLHALKKEFNGTLGMPTPVERDRPETPITRVRCGDCQHFERVDRPRMGRRAKGHGRHWLWDTDRRECADFEAAVEGRP